MADQEKLGTPWGDDELDAIIADYFAMLDSELSGRSYVKARHGAELMERIGRTHRSVEFKHQNISAVLDELGMPWIPGYKPKRNYQAAIFDAIGRYLTAHAEVLTRVPLRTAVAPDDEQPFVAVPVLYMERPRPRELEQLIRKFDPVERDNRNRVLGRAGESFVLEVERRQLAKLQRSDLSERVRWIADEVGDGAGYDILSFDASGRERLIEVKTTNGGANTPFFLSRNEYETAAVRAESWRLYRVHLFAQTPRIFTISPPLLTSVHLRTETWRASFS
jgi:alpha-D-ribose 1-methylphosphonate 5-triphosphate synthase subunit PhnG